jgi:hypothetical protein
LTASPQLRAEIKGGGMPTFENTSTLVVCGNHEPHFTSPEAGGLTSRMLLLRMNNERVRGTDADIPNFARLLVDEEGSAIMMWMLEGAVLDFADKDGSQYRALVKEMQQEAIVYADDSSMYKQWIDQDMAVGDDLDIDLADAMEAFRRYWSRRTTAPFRETWGDFKNALKALCPSVTFAKRTTRPHPNRVYIRGFGFRPDDGDDVRGDNVFPLVKKT